jgi:hypothetical protein
VVRVAPHASRPRRTPLIAGYVAFSHTEMCVPASRRTQPPTVELSAEQIERLNNLTPTAGERHDETNMAVIDR